MFGNEQLKKENKMSVYDPHTWVNNLEPAINANNLNEMEAGINNAHLEIEQLVDGSVPAAKATLADKAVTVDPATELTIGGAKIWVDTTDPLNIIGHIDAR